MEPKLGLDIGGVLRVNGPGGRKIPIPGMAEGLSRIQPYFGTQIGILSKRPEHKVPKTLAWLTRHLPGQVQIARERMDFCQTRPQKAAHAQRRGYTHFVDNRLEVLGYLNFVPHRFLFRPHPHEMEDEQFRHHLRHVIVCDSWSALADLIIATFDFV